MRTAPILAMLLSCGLPAAQAALPSRDPDWPCQQIKITQLSLGALWTGPDLTPYLDSWSKDQQVAEMTRHVAQRRLPLDQAEQAIRDFASAAGAQKREKLLALMAGVFAYLDSERGEVVAGLDRFGRRQKELAEQIRNEMDTLRAQQAAGDAAAEKNVAELGERLNWQTRLFEQRQQEVAYACDVPNVIEQRLFALARTIQGLLD
jgi:hypothetical protein